jgi:hypothetical protein
VVEVLAPNLIEFLERSDPTSVRSLRDEFGSNERLFSTERQLGGSGPASLGGGRAAVVALIAKSLSALVRDMDSLASAIRTTMARVSKIRFSGSLMATIAGGLTGILALALSNEVVQAATAFAAMLGGVAAVTADQFERAPSGARIASTDAYEKIITARSDMELIRLKIERDKILPLSDEELSGMLDRLNQYAVDVQRLRMA